MTSVTTAIRLLTLSSFMESVKVMKNVSGLYFIFLSPSNYIFNKFFLT